MKTRERQPEKAGSLWMEAVCASVKGGVLAGICSVFLLFLFACLISNGIIKEQWMGTSVLLACVGSTMIGGFFATRHAKGKSILPGLGVGGILFLLLVVSGMLVYGELEEEACLKILCSCLAGGSLAGIIGRKAKKKRRR